MTRCACISCLPRLPVPLRSTDLGFLTLCAGADPNVLARVRGTIDVLLQALGVHFVFFELGHRHLGVQSLGILLLAWGHILATWARVLDITWRSWAGSCSRRALSVLPRVHQEVATCLRATPFYSWSFGPPRFRGAAVAWCIWGPPWTNARAKRGARGPGPLAPVTELRPDLLGG